MCGGVSDFFINTIAGIFVNTIIAIFSIYEFVQLSFDGEYDFIYGIISIWLISKLIAIIKYFTLKKGIGFGYYLIPLIFQSEWIMNIKEDNTRSLNIATIYQGIVNTFPIIISNIYLLSDTSRNIDHGYYIALIFIYYIFVGLSVVGSAMQNTEQQNRFYDSIHLLYASIPLNFCFWYLLIQSFNYNWVIGVSFIIINLIAFIIDLLFFKQKQLTNMKIHNILFKILQYLFQYNLVFFTNFAHNFSLLPWIYIFPCTLQCLNVIILQIIKFIYYPLIIETDKAYYSFLVLSLFQFYILFINVYHKLTKQNKYHLFLKCQEQEIQFEQKAIQLLSSKFTYDYKIELEFDLSCLENNNSKLFDKNLITIKNFMKIAYQTSTHISQIIIQDISQQMKIISQFQSPSYKENYHYIENKQTLVVGDKFFENEYNYLMLQNLCQLLKNGLIGFQINSNKIQQVERLLVQITSFNRNSYIFHNCESTFVLKKPVQNILDEISSLHYQNLIYFKYVSELLPINPNVILFDLFEEFN